MLHHAYIPSTYPMLETTYFVNVDKAVLFYYTTFITQIAA